MTRARAIELLKGFQFCCDLDDCTNAWDCEECDDALNMALEALEQQTCDNCKYSEETNGMNCYECVKGISDNFEALEQEPKRGKWLDYLEEGLKWKCSECGSKFTTPWHYCPHCGARMETEQ